jgi:RimJ/RimL family protein N-acetyltransferase
MIAAFLKRLVSGRGDITGVRVDVAEGNRRSWRTLEKLGFVRTLAGVSVPGEAGPHYVYLLANQRSFPTDV